MPAHNNRHLKDTYQDLVDELKCVKGFLGVMRVLSSHIHPECDTVVINSEDLNHVLQNMSIKIDHALTLTGHLYDQTQSEH